MPSRLSIGGTTTMTKSAATGRPRFELPALDLNFGNITDGTNIPPPPASPVQVQKVPTPPQTPPADKDEAVAASDGVDEEPIATPPNGSTGIKRSADEAPLSPATSGRQGSLRRLFSRNMLSVSYTEGRLMSVGGGRPESRGAASVVDDRKSRRNSGWFRRLRGGDSRRSSLLFEDLSSAATPRDLSVPVAMVPKKPSGPPPPMILELVDLEKDDGSLGNDLFKNIK